MSDQKVSQEALERLARDNAQLRGEILATGVLLTQLLQSICRTQLSPHAFAARIIQQAQEAVTGFNPPDGPHASVVKTAALETVKHYDEQIRSVLPI